MTTDAASTRSLEEAVAVAERDFIAAHPKSRAFYERACRVLPGGHTRQTLYFAPFPLTFVRGRGVRVMDLDGHEYINLVGDYAAGVFGHICEPIRRAAEEQLRCGVSLGGLTTNQIELAELIGRRIPSIEQVRFCNSGSEACLFAALLARHATKRSMLLVFRGCYHGGFMIYGATDPPFSIPFPLVKAPYNDLEGTRNLLRTHAADIAAVLVEPMMGAAGCIPATPAFLSMLREETRRIGALLICDEVMTSRLGPGGVQGLRGLTPDLTTLGKFWGGGFAFGAFGGARELMRHLDTRGGGQLLQGGTFNGNAVAMAAGLVGMRDVYTPEASMRLNALGDALRERLNALGRSSGLPIQVTGMGGVMNIHWQSNPIAEPGDLAPADPTMRRLFQLEMFSHGYYVSYRGQICLALPINQHDIDGFVAVTGRYLDRHGDALLQHVGR